MSNLPYAGHHRELVAYQKSRALAQAVFEVSTSFPREETFSLTDQLRRSSRAIGANVAEAWAKRRYEKHFISKLTDADGEQRETQHWIEVAFDCCYISEQHKNALLDQCEEVGRLLGSMIAKSSAFCSGRIMRESTSEYFITPTNQ